MKSETHPLAGEHLHLLADHSRSLQRDARAALKQGDFERAEALIDSAHMLSREIGSLINEVEARQTHECLRLLANEQATVDRFAKNEPPSARKLVKRLKRIGPAIGMSVAGSFALAEC